MMTLIGKFRKGNDYALLWSNGNYNYQLSSPTKIQLELVDYTQEEALEFLEKEGWKLV